ncbi:MAG: hypothetical protein PHV68_09570 [Candidatus Gastranaerophilales bacterium]|nr:hypothetical protein [Candidatus Gastranaerophilales bacterium]
MNIAKLYTFKINDRRTRIEPVEFDRRKDDDRRFFPRIEVLTGICSDIQTIKKFLKLIN